MRYLIVLLLAACAAPPRLSWQRAGATEMQLYMDKGQCESMAVAATGYENRQVEIFAACMRGKGWQLVAR